MTKRDMWIAVVFIGLALVILLTNRLARIVVRETLTHPFRRASISIERASGRIEVEPDNESVKRVATA